MTTENLTYATLTVGTAIRSVHTDERAEIISNENGTVEIELTSGPDRGKTVTMSPAEVITYWRTAAHADEHAADATTTDQRVCVTCEQPITAISPTRYAHSDPSTGRDHQAQPKLAHPMDNDPFAGLDDSED